MNFCRETVEMDVIPGNRRELDPRRPQGIGSEAYLNSTSQGPIPEDARKDGQIHGRSRQFMKYSG
jgi:hypothetical protein